MAVSTWSVQFGAGTKMYLEGEPRGFVFMVPGEFSGKGTDEWYGIYLNTKNKPTAVGPFLTKDDAEREVANLL